MYTDRLGTVRNGGKSYYPFGEEVGTPSANNTYKFASTYRDSATGLDYAVNRYYASGMGRFLTVDRRSGHLKSPQSFNRYTYTRNDPINGTDPTGLNLWSRIWGIIRSIFDGDGEQEEEWDDWGGWGGGGGGEVAQPELPPEGGGGGGSGGVPTPVLHVANISKSGTNYNAVRGRLNEIVNSIDSDCLSFLESGGNKLSAYVSGMLSNDLLAVADFDKGIAAFTGSRGTDMPEGTAAMVVNNGSAFFDSTYNADQGKIAGGTVQAQAFILLHELAHGLEAKDFVPDFNNKDAGKANDQMIEKNCDKTLKGFK
jgi:RHS repeat-associated protein